MKVGMRKMTKTLVMGSALLAITAGIAQAADDKPTADLAVGAYSQYVWRGFALSKDSIVLQPDMAVHYKGFSADVWGNMDTDVWNDDGEGSNNWTETDFTLSYERNMGPVDLTGGYIYYALDGTDSQEVFVSATYDTLLSPTLSVYRDMDHFAGWYVTLGVSHSVPLKDKIALDLGAQVSYLDADDASSYADRSGDAYSAFHDGLLSASVTFPVNEYVSVTPELNYSFPLSTDARHLLEDANGDAIGRSDADSIYGGVSVSLAF